MKTIYRPNLEKMGNQELVDTYNRFVDKWRTARFSSRQQGIESVDRAISAWLKRNPDFTLVTEEAHKEEEAKIPEVATTPIVWEEDTPLYQKKHVEIEVRKSARKYKKDDMIIVCLTPNNPHRSGTKAFDHFAMMQANPRVGDYASQYSNRKDALQWLSNDVRDEFVKLVEPND